MPKRFDTPPFVDANGLEVREDPAPFPEGPSTTAAALEVGIQRHPGRTALVHDDQSFSYSELGTRVDAIAGGLAAAGIGLGSVVACSLPNHTAIVEAFLATQRLGAVWLGINTNLAHDEMKWILDDAEPSLLITAADQTGAFGDVELLNVDIASSASTWTDLIESGRQAPDVVINPHAPAAIAYTSGTTGRPKGAVHSQHNLLWPGISSRSSYPTLPGERHGTALALTILNMLVLGPLWAFLRGTTAILMDRTDAVGLAASVRSHKVNRITLVPAMVHDLVSNPDIASGDLASLSETIIGAGHTSPALREAWENKFGTRAIVGYGLSEAPTGVTREHVDRPRRPDGVGYPLDPVQVLIVDENDLPVPSGETGEVCLTATEVGPWTGAWTPMLGYRNQPDATAAALRGGVLHTGDLGFLDADGQLVIRGRRTELVLRGGANIYPAEVERVLLEHPGIREAAVFGLPDERLGEVVAAGLVAESGPWAEFDSNALLEDVTAFCRERLAGYKVPEQAVILEALPCNAMGKVMKGELAVTLAESKKNNP